jgi:IS5 family transposase
MKQQSLEASGLEKYRKKTRKEIFLDQMSEILPWSELCKVVEPFYPKASKQGGRPTIGIDRMLRIHSLKHWFELSDPSAEEALYDSRAMRQFVGIDFGKEPVPDEATICKSRHLMERHNLGGKLFQLVNIYLEENGLKLNRGMIVDATIIDAPRSTKNDKRQRDPDMESMVFWHESAYRCR